MRLFKSLGEFMSSLKCFSRKCVEDETENLRDLLKNKSVFVKYVVTGRKVLGRGTFDIVYEGKETKTGRVVAVKKINKCTLESAKDKHRMRMNVDVMRSLQRRSNSFLSLFDIYEDKNHLHMVMECAKGGTLENRLDLKGVFSEIEAIKAARGVLQLVAQLHSRHIIHRDIKLENFVYTSNKEDAPLKAIDFGLAFHQPPGAPNVQEIAGCPHFLAPEVFRRDYSFPCDLWSVGVVVFNLLSGRKPFPGDSKLQGVYHALDILQLVGRSPVPFNGLWWDSLSSSVKDFLKRLLHKDPKQRMTAQDALIHPWIVGSSVKQQKEMKTDQKNLMILQDALIHPWIVGSSVKQQIGNENRPKEFNDFLVESSKSASNRKCFDSAQGWEKPLTRHLTLTPT
eukprot:CAMPEP_0196598022 /NCGR_PEP_ID=MMETSP1081-20130531/94072_1 /TAXON_ID=36882 /ORGANISM="Pyramimonas amylifera, Strain CCMP720" /LENGTH=395 /DNA_ID=CAMNT_0041923639 /DNA_START=169 /DNA_END=1357 /DNA_ORIENTATION=+